MRRRRCRVRFASASGLAASAVPAAWLPVVEAAWLSLCAAPLQPWLLQPVLRPCCVLLLHGVMVCVRWSVATHQRRCKQSAGRCVKHGAEQRQRACWPLQMPVCTCVQSSGTRAGRCSALPGCRSLYSSRRTHCSLFCSQAEDAQAAGPHPSEGRHHHADAGSQVEWQPG